MSCPLAADCDTEPPGPCDTRSQVGSSSWALRDYPVSQDQLLIPLA